jgi:hypothetical protein
VVPVEELVASTQQAPDVAVRVTVMVLAATSYVADLGVAACADETAGGGGVDVVLVAFFFGGFDPVEPLRPLFLCVEWVRPGGTLCEPVNNSTTMSTRTTATAVAGAASRRGRWLMEIIALSRCAG